MKFVSPSMALSSQVIFELFTSDPVSYQEIIFRIEPS